MKRSVIISIFLFISIIAFVQTVNIASAESQTDPSIISDEIKKLSHYAEDYESGNIDYAQLLVYIYSTEQNINTVLHDIYFQSGTPISKEQVEDILGKPTGTTLETWSMWQQKMIILDEAFPTWEKVVYDGREIQLVVRVYPDLGLKDGKEFPGAAFYISPLFRLEEVKTSISEFNDIVSQLEEYDKTPSKELAKQISEDISKFQNSFRSNTQQSGNCESEMDRIFGPEGSSDKNEVHSYIITLKATEEYTSNVFFQYCDKCGGFGRIDLKFNVQSNGVEEGQKDFDKEQFVGFTDEQYEKEITNAFMEFSENPKSDLGNKMNSLANSWMMLNYQGDEIQRKERYDNMKEFYTDLFSGYQKQETQLSQREYSKEIISYSGPIDFKKIEESTNGCPAYGKIECDGKIILKGKDSNGCPLEPICISKEEECSTFSSGEGCGKSECNEGDKDYMRCQSGEVLVRKICYNGRWKETGQECKEGYSGESEESQENINEEAESECNSISDCSSGEVCSSGNCVAIPQKSEESNEEILKEIDNEQPADTSSEEEKETESSGEDSGVTGGVIKSIISAFTIEEEKNVSEEIKPEEINEEKNQDVENKEELQKQDESNDEYKEKKDEYKDNYGRVTLGGQCWIGEDGESEGDIYFQLEGKFGEINEVMKNENNNANIWCLGDLKRAILERKALENSLNNEFAKWFFEDYLANNLNQWQRRSGILQDIYNYDTKLSEMIAGSGECSGYYKVPEPTLINLEYESSFGSFKFWEKTFEEKVYKSKEPVEVVAPYMTSWIWPSKEFLEQSITNDPNGFSDIDQPYRGAGMFEEQNELQNSPELSEKVGKLIDEYGNGKDNLLISFKFIDNDNDKVIMNIPIVFTREDISMANEVNTQDVQTLNPDITAIVDFNQLYDLIEKIQKENKENFIVYPQWDKSLHIKQGISGFVNAIELKIKINSIISSIETTPSSARGEVISFTKDFLGGALSKD